jgi:DNA-binding SARP family transcriptional activator
LVIHNHEVGFNCTSPHWLDVEEFEEQLAGVRELSGVRLTPSEAEALRQAIELYRGDVLEGVYEEWCVYERERLKRLFRYALERLMIYHEVQGQFDIAITYAQRLLSCDPLLEHVHRALMRYYYARGDRPAALQQYSACTELLNGELQVEPMAQTVALYEAIRTEHEPGAQTADASPTAAALAAVERLDRVIAELHGLETELTTMRRALLRDGAETMDPSRKPEATNGMRHPSHG